MAPCDTLPVRASVRQGRIEKTCLGEIADVIEEVYDATSCYLAVHLDTETIGKLHLNITAQKCVSTGWLPGLFVGVVVVAVAECGCCVCGGGVCVGMCLGWRAHPHSTLQTHCSVRACILDTKALKLKEHDVMVHSLTTIVVLPPAGNFRGRGAPKTVRYVARSPAPTT